MLRDKSRHSNSLAGYRVDTYSNKLESRSVTLKSELLRDDVSPGDNHYFRVVRYEWDGSPVANGEAPWGLNPYVYRYTDYPLWTSQDYSWQPPSASFPTTAGNGAYAAQLLKMTNPSRPEVDLPVFIAELKDIPQLFKIVGDTALKTVSKANLSYWFGWKPLASDLIKMCDFSSVVNKRAKEIRQLYKTGLSCTRDLDSVSSTSSISGNILTLGGPNSVYYRKDITSRVKVTGHVKWKPTTTAPKTDQELINLARRAAFGLTIDPATAWELIPFSWLVDWFSSVGDFLAAQRNIIPAVPTDLVIMRHTQCDTQITPTSAVPPKLKLSLPNHKYEVKLREPASASLEAFLPYLSLRQMSILGSLWVLKSGRGYRP